jgi:hypothetical protein
MFDTSPHAAFARGDQPERAVGIAPLEGNLARKCVEVRGKLRRGGHDGVTGLVRPMERRDQVMKVHGGGAGDDHFFRRRPHERRDPGP